MSGSLPFDVFPVNAGRQFKSELLARQLLCYANSLMQSSFHSFRTTAD